jgi:hypothetical protein
MRAVLQTAEATGGPPWLVITLAFIGVVGPVTVGVAPLLLERRRHKAAAALPGPAATPHATSPASASLPSAASGASLAASRSPDLALSIVEDALRDAWRQRDDYRRQLEHAQAELARSRSDHRADRVDDRRVDRRADRSDDRGTPHAR